MILTRLSSLPPPFSTSRHQLFSGDSLRLKNVWMSPSQAVLTTVVYERLEDSGKEQVIFVPKPLSPCSRDAHGDCRWQSTTCTSANGPANPYLGLLAVQTHHFSEHAQKEGLQKLAKHGVFSVLGSSLQQLKPRTGCRIAITSRSCPQEFEDLGAMNAKMDTLIAIKGSEGYTHVIDPAKGTYSVNWK